MKDLRFRKVLIQPNLILIYRVCQQYKLKTYYRSFGERRLVKPQQVG